MKQLSAPSKRWRFTSWIWVWTTLCANTPNPWRSMQTFWFPYPVAMMDLRVCSFARRTIWPIKIWEISMTYVVPYHVVAMISMIRSEAWSLYAQQHIAPRACTSFCYKQSKVISSRSPWRRMMMWCPRLSWNTSTLFRLPQQCVSWKRDFSS